MASNTGVVGVLRAFLTADTGQFDTSMRKAGATTDALSKRIGLLQPVTQRLTLGMVALGSAMGTFAEQLTQRTVSALVATARGAFEAANEITDLASKTGLSTTAIQQMQFVAAKTNTTLESLTKAAFGLSANLAGGETSVTKAVAALSTELDGLTVGDLQKLSKDEQWNKVVAALHRVQDEGTRNRLGIQLMGRTYAEVATAVAQDYATMASAARIQSEAQLKALGRQQERFEEFKANLTTGIHGLIADLVLYSEAWFKAEALPDTSFKEARETFKRIREELEKGDIELPNFSKKMNLAGEATAKAGQQADTAGAAWQKLADLQAQAFGLDTVARARALSEAIGGMAGLSLMSRDALSDLNKLMNEAIDAAERNGQLVPLEWLRIEAATRDNIGSLADYLKLVRELPEAFSEIPPPPTLLPLPSNEEMNSAWVASVMAVTQPGSPVSKASQDAGETIGHRINIGIGRAFEQIPHFLISSVLHSGGFLNGLKAIGVQMADAIVEPLIKQFALRLAGARLAGVLAGGAAVGGAVATAGGVAAGAGGGAAAGGAAGGGMLGALGAFATNPITLAAVGAAIGGVLLFRHFRGGSKANNSRDKDLAQFAPYDTAADRMDSANPPGFHGLDRFLSKLGRHDLFSPFVTAGSQSAVRKAWEPIAAISASMGRNLKSYNMGGFVPPGVIQPAILHGGQFGEAITPMGPSSGGGSLVININTIDAAGVRTFVNSDEFTHALGQTFRQNRNSLTTNLRGSLD